MDRRDAPKVAFVSLGCPKNLVDSETILGVLAGAGFHLVSSHDEADAVIINTCGFLEASKEESLEVIHEAVERKRRGKISRVVVAGCLVQRHRAKLLEWAPGIDAMIGVFDRDRIVDAVRGGNRASLRLEAAGSPDDVRGPHSHCLANGGPLPRYWVAGNALQAARDRGINTVGLTVNGVDGRGIGYFEDDSRRFRLTPRHWAYLRVSEGCYQKCAFCNIPSIRGKMRSKPLEKIVAEARGLMADGAFELNLIGQDTTSYGYDICGRDSFAEGSDRRDLVGLLRAVNDVADEFGGGWVRLMYVYPTHFTDEMIDAIAALPNVVKYIDIPLQHISDRMLKSMRRNITRREQEDLLYRLRERIEGLAVRTTLITGFPGETEDDHRELLEFVEAFGFDMLGVFRYSREDGTPAGRMDLDPDLHVPDEVKARREEEIMLLQQQIAFENAQYLAEEGCQLDVLIDGPMRNSPPVAYDAVLAEGPSANGRGNVWTYSGRAYFQAPQVDSMTCVQSHEPLSPGRRVRCTIVDAAGYDLTRRGGRIRSWSIGRMPRSEAAALHRRGDPNRMLSRLGTPVAVATEGDALVARANLVLMEVPIA